MGEGRFEVGDNEERITWGFSTGRVHHEESSRSGLLEVRSSIGPFGATPPKYEGKMLTPKEAVRAQAGLLATVASARMLTNKDFTHMISPNKYSWGFAEGVEGLGYKRGFDYDERKSGYHVKVTKKLARRIIRDFGKEAVVPEGADTLAEFLRATKEKK